MSQRIYLDHAATSPLRPEAHAAMEEGFRLWANPSSPHAEGRKARAALEDARERIKAALAWDGELIFTSGASEAAALAMDKAKVDRRVVSSVEHDAVFLNGLDSHDVILPVGADGYPGRNTKYEALGVTGLPDRDQWLKSLLCMQHVNSETGAILPLAGRGPVEDRTDALTLADCSQSAGKIDLPNTDMAIISAHKLGGPIGIGALLVRDFAMLHPSGGHERGYRRGTENLPAAMGFAAALEAGEWQTNAEQRAGFWDRFDTDRNQIIEHVDYIGALAYPTMSAQALLIRLDAMGFAVSAGSACSSGTLKKSRVLDGFGVPGDVAARTIRVSLGWNTTSEDLSRFAEAWDSLA